MSRLQNVPPALELAMSQGDSPSTPSIELHPGDLWVLSWDGKFLGLAMISAVKQDFVLAWPVTLPNDVAFAPALISARSPLKTPVAVWPSREVGLGIHLLDQPLGRLLDPARIQSIAWALEDGEDPGMTFAPSSAHDDANREADQTLLDHWTALCLHTWPPQPRRFLSESKIKGLGGSASSAARTLGLSAPQLRPIWTGTSPVEEQQARSLASSLGADTEDILGGDPLARVLNRLAHPQFKQPLIELAASQGWTEGIARDAAREEYALAARDDSRTVEDQRILDAIKRCRTRND